MAVRSRFTRFIAALFLATLVLSAFASPSADVSDPGGGTCPNAPSDTVIAETQSAIPQDDSATATELFTAAYLLLCVL